MSVGLNFTGIVNRTYVSPKGGRAYSPRNALNDRVIRSSLTAMPHTGYYKWEGVRGEDNNSDSYGFKIKYGNETPVISYLIFNLWNYNPTNLEFSYTAFENVGPDCDVSQCNMDGLGDYLVVSNCYFKDASVFIHSVGDFMIVENTYFEDNWSSSGNHGASINCPGDNYIIRNSVFDNASNGTGCLEIIKLHTDGEVQNWLIYNNSFFDGNNKSIVTQTDANWAGMSNWKVFNNTFVNTSGAFYNPNWGEGNEIRNNLYYNPSHSFSYSMGCTWSNNYYNNYQVEPIEQPGIVISNESIEDMFVDHLNHDFSLKSPSVNAVDKGLDLSIFFSNDKTNTLRPQGDAWDIGAYEYDEGYVPEEEQPEDEIFILNNFFPNPMTEETNIPLVVFETGYFKLDVMSSLGKHIKNIQNGELAPGSYNITWDGKNVNGSKVAIGTYFITITVNGVRKLGKVVMFK